MIHLSDNLFGWAFLIIAIVALLGAITWLVFNIIRSYHLWQLSKKREEYRRKIHEENLQFRSIDYSEQILAYLRSFIGHVAVLKFQEFKDNNSFAKVTREHTKPLVKDVAFSVKESLKVSNINEGQLLFTDEYLNKFIIDVSVHSVKRLLEDEVKNAE